MCSRHFFLLIFVVLCSSCWFNGKKEGRVKSASKRKEPVLLSYKVVATYKHNPLFYTQGLYIINDDVLEGTGQRGESAIYQYKLLRTEDTASPRIRTLVKLDNKFFGEGITVLGDKLYQLTWQSRSVFVYDYPSMKKVNTMKLRYEGWGITDDDHFLIVSDGTSLVRWLDKKSFKEVKKLRIKDQYGRIDRINELELIEGKLYANRWQTNYILEIDTASGQVVGKADLSSLALDAKATSTDAEVLNGIAYREATKTIFVTGKRWAQLYELEIGSSNLAR